MCARMRYYDLSTVQIHIALLVNISVTSLPSVSLRKECNIIIVIVCEHVCVWACLCVSKSVWEQVRLCV